MHLEEKLSMYITVKNMSCDFLLCILMKPVTNGKDECIVDTAFMVVIATHKVCIYKDEIIV